VSKKREINLSSLAFIDVMACGLGAVILLFFILDFDDAEIEKVSQPPGIEEPIEHDSLIKQYHQLALEKKDREKTILSSAKDLSEKMIKLLELEVPLVLARIDPQKNEKVPILDDLSNQPGKLIGISLAGEKILVVLDTSASMAHDKLIDIIVGLSDVSGERLANGEKWRQAKRVGQWLIQNAPETSEVRVLSYADIITFSHESWTTPAIALEQFSKLKEEVNPKFGTSLGIALEHIERNGYRPSDIYLITDGLPTLPGAEDSVGKIRQIGNECFRRDKKNSYVDGDCRRKLFVSAASRFQRNSTARLHVILLPLEGDPEAAPNYQHWANQSGGTLFAPAQSWLR
jgi:hypothetical protein